MKHSISFAIALALAAPAFAQDTINSTSGSNAGANSASQSGSEANNQNANTQGQQQQLNGNIGRSDANSNSASTSTSSSATRSDAYSDQQQGQAIDSSNSASNSASNQQGVSVSNTFNSTNHKRSYVGTNTAIPLAASSSFSSDFCGSTSSGGASAAPIGISLGLSGTKYDQTCRSLRVAEKAGMMAVSASNMGFKDMAAKLMAFSTWNICTANGKATVDACKALSLLGVEAGPTQDVAGAQSTEESVKKAASVEVERINRSQTPFNATATAQTTQPPGVAVASASPR